MKVGRFAARAFILAPLVWLPFSASFGQTGSILPNRSAGMSTRAAAEADRAHQTMNDYGICLVKAREVAIRKAAALLDEQIDAAMKKLATDDCLGQGELRMPAALMRGAVYRALYIRDFGKSMPAAPAVALTVASNRKVDNPLQLFGQCVTDVDAANVRAFVMAVPATQIERAALQNLTPALARCVAPGEKIGFSRATLQGVLAEAAYRTATTSSVNN